MDTAVSQQPGSYHETCRHTEMDTDTEMGVSSSSTTDGGYNLRSRPSFQQVMLSVPQGPPAAPAITAAMIAAIEHIPGTEEKSPIHNYDGEKWLTDDNINPYFALIKKRNEDNSNYPTVYSFGCYFYRMYCNFGYKQVREATDADTDDMFKFHLTFFPCLISHHWRLVVLDTRAKTLLLYDSLIHTNSQTNELCLKRIASFVKQEYQKIRRRVHGRFEGMAPAEKRRIDKMVRNEVVQYFQAEHWTVKVVETEDIPQQKNFVDCGAFILQYAEYLSRMAPFDFDSTHMKYFRSRMKYETLRESLIIG